MRIGRAFGAPLRDERWLSKLAVASFVGLIPIVNFAIPGFGISYLRNCAYGREEELPSWSEFGKHWVRGLTFSFASAVYYLPVFLIVLAFGLPGALLGGISQGGVEGGMAVLSSVMAGVLVAALFAMFVSVLVQAARANYAVGGEFSDAFKWGRILAAVKTYPSGYFVAWMVSVFAPLGAYIVAGGLATVLHAIPCLGSIVSILLTPVFYGDLCS